jgi:hypothetical protein
VHESNQKTPTLPEGTVKLSSLPDDHVAKVYLRERHFDPDRICRIFNVRWCESSNYKPADFRIIIPIYKDASLVGWQSRHPGDDWEKTGLPKYFTVRGTQKGNIIYNLDLAKRYKFGVMCEGALDAWRLEQNGMAYFGACPSYRQRYLAIKSFLGYGLAIAPDREVVEEMKHKTNTSIKWDELRAHGVGALAGNFLVLKKLGVKDMGEFKCREDACAAIEEQCEQNNVQVDWGVR